MMNTPRLKPCLRFVQCCVRSCHVQPLPTPSILLYVQMHCYLPFRQLDYDFGDFENGVEPIVKIATGESSPDMNLLKQQTFCFSPNVLARDSKMPTMYVYVLCCMVVYCVFQIPIVWGMVKVLAQGTGRALMQVFHLHCSNFS